MQKKSNPLLLVLGLSVFFFVAFVALSAAIFFSKSSSIKGSLFSSGSVGVIELNGLIIDSKKILNRLEQFDEDPQVKSVVFRINSPGGMVAPSQEIYQAVKTFKKPLVVSLGSMATSGALYVAVGAKKVFANPGTLTGSIGVIMEFANLEKLYEWAKVQRYVIKSGKFKDIGSTFREMTDEERELMQGTIEDILIQFKEAIASGRNLSMEEVNQFADGRVFSGKQAHALRVVDELGGLSEAIQEAANQAQIKGKPHVVYAEKQKRSLLDLVLDDPSPSESSSVGWLKAFLLGRQTPPGLYWVWGDALVP